MAELFMECEEEELEPWQQKVKPIVVDDDDDDEPIFVGEILSSKPSNTYILNRVNPSSPRIGMQNGAPKRGAVAVSPGFPSATRPVTSTLAVQPQPRVSNVSGTSQVLQRPLSGCSSLQEAAKASTGISQPINRSATTQSLARNLGIPVMAQSPSRPVATVTAQPVSLNRVIPNNPLPVAFDLRQNSGVTQCQSGSAVTKTAPCMYAVTCLSKRPSTSEAHSINPKKPKADEAVSGSDSPSVISPNDTSLLQKGIASSNVKHGAPFPQACPKCNIHFNLLEPLKNHIKYCCPDMAHTFLGITQTDSSGTSSKMAETEKGKLIMLVNDFYYGKHEGNVQQVRQEQKTHTTFKCASCMKLLKSNIRFMNHMKHHLELEKQNSESWESHTTCQHCYRQFPTPFQLQCHIESSHTPHESSTLCKICELSFETEQVLLQHMKDNHKPGEMPYVCQVCNYRSSAFSDVEKHFRSVHENTKSLLCPFCLKVIKLGAPYMHHFLRHQKKGVHRCTKCRLQFLTCKEKMDHKSQHHRTFKKPAQLEGLPPGTKVTIRASAGSLQPGSATASPVIPSASTLHLSTSAAKVTNAKTTQNKANANKVKPKLKPLSVQKKQGLGTTHNNSCSSSSSSSGGGSKRNNKIANTALNNLRCPNIQKCIECYSDIRTFASHFPAYVRCSLCRYSTSCSKAYVNHMMSFHSARQSKRFWIYKTHSEDLRGVTLVCLNCEFLTDASGLDNMATHLNENLTHTCQVIIENVPSDCLVADNISHLVSDTSLNSGSEETSQEIPRLSAPEEQKEQKETSISASPEIEHTTEETDKDHLENQSGEASLEVECEENKLPVLENSLGSELQACSNDFIDSVDGGETEGLGNQRDGSPFTAEFKEKIPPCPENTTGPVFQACSKDSLGEGNSDDLANQGDEDGSLAAECEENPTSPVLENSNNPINPAEKTDMESFVNQTDEGPLPAACVENMPMSPMEDSSMSEHQTCSKGSTGEGDLAVDLANQGDGPLAAGCEEGTLPLVLENSSGSGLDSASSNDPAKEEDTGAIANQTDEGLLAAAACVEKIPVSPMEDSSISEHNSCSKGSTEEGDLAVDLVNQEDEGPLAAGCEEGTLPLVLENSSGSGLDSASSNDPAKEEDMGAIANQTDEGLLAAAACVEKIPVSPMEDSSISEHNSCSKGSTEEEDPATDLANQGDEAPLVAKCKEEKSPCLENISDPGFQACSKDGSGQGETGNLANQDVKENPLPSVLANQEVKENLLPSVLENSKSGFAASSNDSIDPVSKDTVGSLANQDSECYSAAECEESTSTLVLGNLSGSGLSDWSNDPIDPMEDEDAETPANQSDEGLAAKCKESPSAGEESSVLEPHVCAKGSAEDASKDHLENQTDEHKESTSVSAVKDSCSGSQASSTETSCERTESDDLGNSDQIEEGKSPKASDNKTNSFQSSKDAVFAAETKVADLDEAELEDINSDHSKLASDEDVSFEQFLRRSEPESVNSDASEQGSVHLEPLTPSEVLEYEATEILQKGGVPPSAKKAEPGSELEDSADSEESSPASPVESPVSQAEESDEAS
ncbi:finger 280D isoform X1 [Podarcis lilfordi]|uniref:Finger 280D isoform X1 n=1 Tax=Podarcis lilfordi TaxID=74358 RepID=A0AA35PQC6_9SAUR|nr:finger 280D isoform X1 [Podarcis lilfordi]